MLIANYPVNGGVHSGEQVAEMDFGPLASLPDEHFELVLKLRKTASSLNLRISLAGSGVKRIVAGNLYTYGEGIAEGAPAPERFFPLTLSLDITEAARVLAGAPRVEVYLDILDGRGRKVTNETVFVQTIDLQTIDGS